MYGKKYILIFFTVFCSLEASSQNFFASIFAGSVNYSGDLQEKRFTFQQAHPALGLGLLYEINDRLLIRGDFAFGKLSADDKYSRKNKSRNLSFYSDISEYSLGVEYTFINLYKYKVSPYIFTGIALFDFNPYTKDVNNKVIFLAEVNTEGQGFYEGRKDYKLRQFSIPLGGGIQWAINDNKRIGLTVGFRKTFTDYIDDVSTTYVDEDILVAAKGQAVANIAYRGDELANGNPAYPTGGSIRGNSKSKDSYYFAGLTFRVRILPKGHYRELRFNLKKHRRESLKCPKY